ncbi:MAG TPA: universal stress protein [Candidatus Limnocylindrales bacterium]|jgi:nucleotide-binding universal stress UspA family protein|nr:universal stress protein [Candidatus Limnocylindrales bacterium]
MAERMRVLLATDDSIAARVAEPWVTGGRWAKPPIVDVLSVAAPTVAAGPWLGRVRVGDAVGAIRELERAEHAQAEAVAEGVARRLAAAGVEADARAATGEPAAEILAAAKSLGSDLIMLGPRGRSELASALLGGVSQQVLAHSPVPLLLARPGNMAPDGLPHTVVLLVDGTLGALAAANWLGRTGWLAGCVVVLRALLGAAPGLADDEHPVAGRVREAVDRAAREALGQLADVVTAQASEVRVEMEAGHPLHAALAAESAHRSDLLVVARRRPRPGDHPLADKVTRYASTSVLMVPLP